METIDERFTDGELMAILSACECMSEDYEDQGMGNPDLESAIKKLHLVLARMAHSPMDEYFEGFEPDLVAKPGLGRGED